MFLIRTGVKRSPPRISPWLSAKAGKNPARRTFTGFNRTVHKTRKREARMLAGEMEPINSLAFGAGNRRVLSGL
jgi:hypothetical protein